VVIEVDNLLFGWLYIIAALFIIVVTVSILVYQFWICHMTFYCLENT